MDNEFSAEKKSTKEGVPSWKEQMEKIVGKVKNNLFVKGNSNTADQIKWMQQRPLIDDIHSLLAKSTNESELSSEERTLTSCLQDVVGRYSELRSKIDETINSNNVWRARSLWTNAVELGVSFPILLSRLGEVEAEKGAHWYQLGYENCIG
jgi:hypothetical protein